MSNIKVKNVSDCTKCTLCDNCAAKDDYNTFVATVTLISNTYNSINGNVSMKCKKEKKL